MVGSSSRGAADLFQCFVLNDLLSCEVSGYEVASLGEAYFITESIYCLCFMVAVSLCLNVLLASDFF